MTKKQMESIVKMYKNGVSAITCITMIIEFMQGQEASLVADRIFVFISIKDR